jgi:hypothetical protein
MFAYGEEVRFLAYPSISMLDRVEGLLATLE